MDGSQLQDDKGRFCVLCAVTTAFHVVCGKNKYPWLLQPDRLNGTLAKDKTAAFTLIVVMLLKVVVILERCESKVASLQWK